MDLKTELLEYLVKRYEETTGTQMIHDHTMQSGQNKYYFLNLNDNLIEPMSEETEKRYREADGNELQEKMRAIRSSSAMTYNVFGNDAVMFRSGHPIFGSETYQVNFEKQLNTIKRSSKKANLDACLVSEDELMYFEVKMTEWLFNKPGTISHNYLDQGHYFYEEAFGAFSSLINQIAVKSSKKETIYESCLNQYDGVQMLKHLLGIYNDLMSKNAGNHKKVRLINCIWELPDSKPLSPVNQKIYDEKHRLEREEFQQFYQAAKPVLELFREKGIDFDIRLISVKELLTAMEKTEQQKKFLERYL